MDYQLIEELFVEIFALLDGVLSESANKEIHLFFDAGEYGLALESLLDILDGSMFIGSNSISENVKRLKEIMEM